MISSEIIAPNETQHDQQDNNNDFDRFFDKKRCVQSADRGQHQAMEIFEMPDKLKRIASIGEDPEEFERIARGNLYIN